MVCEISDNDARRARARNAFRTAVLTVLVAMALALLGGTASAQTLAGIVTDATGGALPGVSVTGSPLPGGPPRSTVTDETGAYVLDAAGARAIVLHFVLPGFADRRIRVTVPETGLTGIDMVLPLTSVAEHVRVAAALDEEQSLGTRLGLTRQQTPASVDLVTQDVLRARGADVASSSMRGVTGVTSSLRPGASAVFSTRGFTENSIGVLFGGVRVQSSTVTMRNYDVFNFERVEVLRGPASVQHGEGLAAGAVNFVRRSAESGPGRVEGLLEVGDAGRFRFGAAAAGSLGDRSAYSVSFARNRFGTHVQDAVHEYNHLTGAFRTAVGRFAVTAEGDLLVNDVDDPYWGTPLVNGRVDARLRGRNYNRSDDNRYKDAVAWGRVTAAAALSDRVAYTGQVFTYRADRDWRNSYGFEYLADTDEVLRRAVENLAYDHRAWGTRHELRSETTLGGRALRLAGGIDLSVTDFSSPRSYGARVAVSASQPEVLAFVAPTRADDRRADLDQRAVFGEMAYDVVPNLTAVVGGRVGTLSNDIRRPASGVAFTQDFTPADGRAGVVYTPRSDVSIYGQYATGSEPVEALLILGPTEGAFDLARSRLREAGVKSRLWQGRADLTLAVYHLAKRDLTTADPEDSTRTIQIGRQSSRGIELSIVARPSESWLIEGNVAALRARYDLFFEGPVSRAGLVPPNVPERVLNLGATWRPRARIEAGAWVAHVGGRTADTTGAHLQPAYTLIDPFVRAALGRTTDVTLRVRNATDLRYVEWATRAFGVTNVYFGEPRRVVLSVSVRR